MMTSLVAHGFHPVIARYVCCFFESKAPWGFGIGGSRYWASWIGGFKGGLRIVVDFFSKKWSLSYILILYHMCYHNWSKYSQVEWSIEYIECDWNKAISDFKISWSKFIPYICKSNNYYVKMCPYQITRIFQSKQKSPPFLFAISLIIFS